MKSDDGFNRGIFGIDGSLPEGEVARKESADAFFSSPQTIRNNVSVRPALALGRLRFGVAMLLVLFGVFTARTAYLQVFESSHFREVAENNRVRYHAIPSHRGVIKDRNGIVLADNSPSFRLVAYGSSLPPLDELDAVLTRIAADFSLDEAELKEKILATYDAKEKTYTVEEVLLAEDLPYEKALDFLTKGEVQNGITVELSEKREYITSAIPSLSHVLGYTGAVNEEEYALLKEDGYRKFDIIGKQGVEAAHEQELRGAFGEEVVEVDARGRLLRTLSRKDPVAGVDLTLTIDAQLQAYIEQVLEKYFETRSVKRGAVVAIDPRNGEVLALVSYPAFDANLFTSGISTEDYSALVNDPNAPLFPRATSGEYPSGSTIKPFFAAAALTEGIITPSTTFLSTGGLMLGDRFFPDWRPGGHGITNVYHAIADSVNTFFYMIGGGNETFKGLGVEKLMEWARKFGLGEKTGIDLTGESAGFLPSKEWKEEVKGEPWYIGDTYNVSIGQGDVLVTPLQMARGTAAIANGGLLVQPHLVLGEDVPEETRIIDEDIANIVREGMRQTVVNGTARSLQILPTPSGAKTGTAQWNANKVPHSWFTGFAPYDNPEITIAVIIEEGGDITAAVPVAKDILNWYLTEHSENAILE